MLKLEGVSYRYPGAGHASLHAVSLELTDGTITGLTGPAEGGMSTLCLVAGGLAPRVVGGSLVGDISLDGADITSWPMHRLTECVVTGLQDPGGQLSLIADTVLEEVAFGPANLGLPRGEVTARSEEALQLIGIEALADRGPGQLSGGQLQLVVMAGLLAMRPRHLILDQPVSRLDARNRGLVLEAVTRIAAAGTAVLIAEHQADALAGVCESLVVIARGHLVHQGAVDEVLADPAVAALGIETTELRLRRQLNEAGLDPDPIGAAP